MGKIVIVSLLLGVFRLWAEADYMALNVVPYSPGQEERAAADARTYVERTGDEFVLYSLSLHPEGRPATNKLFRCVESYRKFAKALEGTRAKPGVLIQSVLGHWPRVDKDEEPWTRSVNVKGEKVRYCPEDPDFKAYIFLLAREVAKTKPAFVLTDDDLRAYSHDAECFCPRHVADLNRRLGTSYDEVGACAAVTASKAGDRTYEAFIAMQREMVENVARTIRAGFDSVDPTIPCGSSMPGEEPRWAVRTARIVAAKGQVPVIRVCNAHYNEGAPKEMYGNVLMTYAKSALCGEGVRIIEEADTFPQNLWSKSAVSFHSKSVIGVMCGLTGAKRWFVGAHTRDGEAVDGTYTDVLADHRGQLAALARAVRGAVPGGLAIPLSTHFKSWHPVTDKWELGYSGVSAAERWFGPYGLPFYATESLTDDAVYALMGTRQVDRFTDDELRKLLSGRLFVDGSAALALCRRGFADLLGVDVTADDFRYNGEVTDDGALLRFGKTVGTPRLVAKPGAAILSRLVYTPYAGAEPETAGAGTTVFRNRLGGRVAVTAFHVNVPWYQQWNEGRKRFLLKVLARLGFEDPYAENNQHVLTLVRRAPDGSQVVSVTNLGYDPLDPVKLHLPEGASVSALMDNGGLWRAVEPVRLAAYETAVLRLEQRIERRNGK